MKSYTAIVNLNLFITADSETEAQRLVNGEFVDRLLSITANKDDLFDFEFELIQIEEN